MSAMYRWKLAQYITKNIATYNITFNPTNKKEGSESYVQLGDINQVITRDLTWVKSSDWDYFRSPVTNSFFKTDVGKVYPFVEFETFATFDPEVDYMYVNQLEFTSFMVPVLKEVYGSDLICTDNECHLNKTCDAVEKFKFEITFSISTEASHY